MPPTRIYLSPPHMTGREIEYLEDVIASNWIAPTGPHLTQFEKDFSQHVDGQHTCAVISGTAAIHLALRHLNLKPGDEVICSSFTFCASANPIRYEHAQPVFIDSDRKSWNMDPNLLADELVDCAAQGKLPRAIIVVDILGQSADMDEIVRIASAYDIPVIEDAAEALGGKYKGESVGGKAWSSIFSFNGNKIITTSGGGMLCSHDEKLIEEARFLAMQARDPLPHYEHSKVGFNYRLSNVLAAIGIAQLEALNERVAIRRNIFNFYRQQLGVLPGITMMPEAHFADSNYWLSVIQVDKNLFGASPEEIRLHLETDNVETRQVWKPLHCQPVFQGCRVRGGEVAEELFQTGLCLPSGTAMTENDLLRVVHGIQEMEKS